VGHAEQSHRAEGHHRSERCDGTFLTVFPVWAFAIAWENARNGQSRRLDGGTGVVTGDAGASGGDASAGCDGGGG
jgi:hypothetical protein